MVGSWKRSCVRCPFYLSDDVKARKISCEGMVDKSVLSTTFRKRDDFMLQIEIYCCKHYEKCEIYRMLMKEKYEEEL